MKSSDTRLISQIKELPLSSVVTDEFFFLNLKPHQAVVYCKWLVSEGGSESGGKHDKDENLLDCRNLYIWKMYFQKYFTDEYNDYIQSLFEIYEESPEFYHDRLEYIVLRDVYPLLANIKGIRRDGSDKVKDFYLVREGEGFKVVGKISGAGSVKYVNLGPNDSFFDLKYLLGHIGYIKDFRSMYQLVTFKSRQQRKIKNAITNALVGFLNMGSETYVPLEFIELAYLKMGVNVNYILSNMNMFRVLYGTSYYLDSIKVSLGKNLADEKYFNKRIGLFLVKDKNGNLNVIKSFIKFTNLFEAGIEFEYNEEKKQLLFINYIEDETINAQKKLEDILVFFNLSLRYLMLSDPINLKYDEKTIRKASILVGLFLEKIEIVYEDMDNL